jgi:hypothetical protein
MSILKDLFIEEYDLLLEEAEERGEFPEDDELADKASKMANERLRDMCDEAKDRAKYKS